MVAFVDMETYLWQPSPCLNPLRCSHPCGLRDGAWSRPTVWTVRRHQPLGGGGGSARGWGADGDGGGGGGGGGGVRCGQAPNIRRRLTLRVARGGLRCLAAGSVGGGWEPVTPARADQMGASGGPGRPVPEGDPWGWDLRNPVVHANHTLCPRHSQTEHSPSRLQT